MDKKYILLIYLRRALILPIFLFASERTSAENRKPNQIPQGRQSEEIVVTKKDRKATLNFEDELVQGTTQKPELFYLFQKKNFNYKRLIKLRENFLPEMRKTTEDVQRVRGGG